MELTKAERTTVIVVLVFSVLYILAQVGRFVIEHPGVQ